MIVIGKPARKDSSVKETAEYMWLVQLDIPGELEAEFNRIYDTEHVPYICAVPGVLGVQRYVLEKPVGNVQKYATVYRVSSPDLPQSAAWRAASDRGEWSTKIRPHTANASLAMFRALPKSPRRQGNSSPTTP